MEYVANAQGQDVVVASVIQAAIQPASVGANATIAAALGAAAVQPARAATAAVTLSRASKIIFAVTLIVAYVLGVLTKAIL